MHRDWTITWVQRSQYAIRSHTGYLATDVEMSVPKGTQSVGRGFESSLTN
jgi:hypothetical protein